MASQDTDALAAIAKGVAEGSTQAFQQLLLNTFGDLSKDIGFMLVLRTDLATLTFLAARRLRGRLC